MGRHSLWTKDLVLAALREGKPVSWSVVIRYWRSMNAARAEAGVPNPVRRKRKRRGWVGDGNVIP